MPVHVPVPPLTRSEVTADSRDPYDGQSMTWACPTPRAADVMAAVFAGDFAASPRGQARTRLAVLRASVALQPALPLGASVAVVTRARRRVPTAAQREAVRRDYQRRWQMVLGR